MIQNTILPRLLHHGRKVQTVLEYLLNTPPDEQSLDAVLMEGYRGTGCVEAGGPNRVWAVPEEVS